MFNSPWGKLHCGNFLVHQIAMVGVREEVVIHVGQGILHVYTFFKISGDLHSDGGGDFAAHGGSVGDDRVIIAQVGRGRKPPHRLDIRRGILCQLEAIYPSVVIAVAVSIPFPNKAQRFL